MIQGIEATYRTDVFFEGLRYRWATKLYEYSRSDFVQLGRWSIDLSAGLRLSDTEIRDVTTIATLCIVLLAGKFLASHGHSADSQRIEALAADYAEHPS